jgi:hypothetical protein
MTSKASSSTLHLRPEQSHRRWYKPSDVHSLPPRMNDTHAPLIETHASSLDVLVNPFAVGSFSYQLTS